MLKKLKFNPGVNTTATLTDNPSGWAGSNLVRWKEGYLQKYGGWKRFLNSTVSGVTRAMHAWADTSGADHLAFASLVAVQEYSGAINDISPIAFTNDEAPNFSTISGSNVVTVFSFAGGFATAGIQVIFPVQVSVGGLLISGSYTIQAVISTTTFTIATPSTATATVNSGGNVPFFVTSTASSNVTVTLANHGQTVGSTFIIPVSTSVGGLTLLGAYTVASVVDVNNFTVSASPSSNASASENSGLVQIVYLIGGQDWNIDNFGQDLILTPVAVPSKLNDFFGMFVWTPPYTGPNVGPNWGIGNHATIILSAPLASIDLIVAMPQAQVISAGSSIINVGLDPLLLAWCDAGDFTSWTADATNQAGTFRLSRGSVIRGAMQAPQTTLIWTDIDLWSMNYISLPFIYGFTIIGSGCGLIARRAKAVLAYTTFWMSQRDFFVFGGQTVSKLPCAVWDVVFGDLDANNLGKIFAAPNSAFGEVMFFYPSLSGGTGEIDSYVKYTPEGNLWDYGKLVRTAWIDQSVWGMPLAVDANLLIQQHETGYDADNVPMANAFAMTGFTDIGDGSQIIFIDQLIPDLKWLGTGGSISFTLFSTNYPGQPTTMTGPYTVTQTTQYIRLRVRARQIALRIDWAASSGFSARLGATRVSAAPAGRTP